MEFTYFFGNVQIFTSNNAHWQKHDNSQNYVQVIAEEPRPINFNLYISRLKQDRLRQEQLARERLAQLRERRKAKEQEAEDKLVTDGDTSVLQEAVMKALEHKHQDERQVKLKKNQDKKV